MVPAREGPGCPASGLTKAQVQTQWKSGGPGAEGYPWRGGLADWQGEGRAAAVARAPGHTAGWVLVCALASLCREECEERAAT